MKMEEKGGGGRICPYLFMIIKIKERVDFIPS